MANNNIYIKAINEDSNQREVEILTTTQKLNEFIMISLRTSEGIDLEKLEVEFGVQERMRILHQVRKFIEKRLVQHNDSFIHLTEDGMLRADGIASELFIG